MTSAWVIFGALRSANGRRAKNHKIFYIDLSVFIRFGVVLICMNDVALSAQNPLFSGVNRAQFLCAGGSPEHERICDAVESALRANTTLPLKRQRQSDNSRHTLGVLDIELEFGDKANQRRARLVWSNRKAMAGGPISVAGSWVEFAAEPLSPAQIRTLSSQLAGTKPE